MSEPKFDIDDAIGYAELFESGADSMMEFNMESFMSNAELVERIRFLKREHRDTVYNLGRYIRSAKKGVLIRD